MQVKLLDSINASASVKISALQLKSEVEKLAKNASKTLKMDGFRPGKVPVSAVISRYGKELEKDAQQNLLKAAVNEALKELKRQNTELVAEPYFENFKKENGEISTNLLLSFRPIVNLDGYEALIPKFTAPKAEKKEIEAKKQEILKSLAKTNPIKSKRGLKMGDFAKFDFEGFLDGVAFDGGKAENFTLEIGSKQFIPGFEEGMVGMKEGENKDIKVKFPKDYNAPNLAGKEAIFKIKLHEIRELEIPSINDEILKQILPNEKEISEKILDEKLSAQIAQEKLNKLINDDLREKFSEALIKKYKFDLPKGVVEQETDIQFRNAWSGFSQEELDEIRGDSKKYQAKRDTFRADAEKSVQFTFIVDELAKIRKIQATDQEVIQAVYFEAYRYNTDPRQLLENYKNQGILPAIKMSIVEQKLFADIFTPNSSENLDAKSENSSNLKAKKADKNSASKSEKSKKGDK